MVYQLHRDNEEYFCYGRCLSNLHFHRAIELIYCITNQKPIIISGKEMTLEEGELLFVPPLVPHLYVPVKTHRSLCVVMPVSYSDILEEHIKGKSFSEYIVHDKALAKDIFDHMCMLENCTEPLLKQGIYTYIIARIISHLPLSESEDKRKADFSVNVLIYIEKHYAEKLSSKTVAKALGYNHCYFSSLFNQAFRSNFTYYLNMVRINKALPLLKKHTVSHTAEAVGFNNLQSFYSNFKKVTGKTPSEYLHGINKK
ncbi:MAG: helix-turn-helix domain-containing protein [Clostridia bacterium]|nr:helix-turn-helix domain-containing protein [Clostridia bacterium]